MLGGDVSSSTIRTSPTTIEKCEIPMNVAVVPPPSTVPTTGVPKKSSIGSNDPEAASTKKSGIARSGGRGTGSGSTSVAPGRGEEESALGSD